MDALEFQKNMANLHRQYVKLMQEYADATRRDETFQVKRRLLERMRIIEKEIKRLQNIQQIAGAQ